MLIKTSVPWFSCIHFLFSSFIVNFASKIAEFLRTRSILSLITLISGTISILNAICFSGNAPANADMLEHMFTYASQF